MSLFKIARVKVGSDYLLALLGIQGGRICGGKWDEDWQDLELLISHDNLPEIDMGASVPLHYLEETIETASCVTRRTVKIGETIVGDTHNDSRTF